MDNIENASLVNSVMTQNLMAQLKAFVDLEDGSRARI